MPRILASIIPALSDAIIHEYYVLAMGTPLVMLPPGTLSGKYISIKCFHRDDHVRKINEALASETSEVKCELFEIFVGFGAQIVSKFLDDPIPDMIGKFCERMHQAFVPSSTKPATVFRT